MAAKTLEDRQRLQKKYWTDVLINPLKVVFLILPTVLVAISASPILIAVVITLGCLGFMIAESIHCKAHIDGAFAKNKNKDRHNKYKAWLPMKVGITSLRLIASLTGAAMLAMASIFASAGIFSSLIPVITVIYIVAFISSSAFSTAHKVRGLDSLNKKNASRLGLFMRALIGVAGLVLSILVMLKPPALMILLMNPVMVILVPIVGGLILIGMLIAKVHKARSNERAIEKIEKEENTGSFYNPALDDFGNEQAEDLTVKNSSTISLDSISVSTGDEQTSRASASFSSDASSEELEADSDKAHLLIRRKTEKVPSSPSADITPTAVPSSSRPGSSSFHYSAGQSFFGPPTPKNTMSKKPETEVEAQIEKTNDEQLDAQNQTVAT